MRRILAVLLLTAITPLGSTRAADAKKRLLAIGEEKGFRHEAVSHALATIERLGRESGLWDTTIRTDTEALTKKKLEYNAKNLNDFDAVLFYTGGTLEMDDQKKADFLSFIHDDGKGFIGVHSATITFTNWPEYGEMIGGYSTSILGELSMRRSSWKIPVFQECGSGPGLRAQDEIYQMRNFSRDKLRVLMRLDASKLDLNNPRVHRKDQRLRRDLGQDVWQGPCILLDARPCHGELGPAGLQKMYVEAIKWALGLVDADVTPRPAPEKP